MPLVSLLNHSRTFGDGNLDPGEVCDDGDIFSSVGPCAAGCGLQPARATTKPTR